MTDAFESLPLPERIGRYRVLRVLGRGGKVIESEVLTAPTRSVPFASH